MRTTGIGDHSDPISHNSWLYTRDPASSFWGRFGSASIRQSSCWEQTPKHDASNTIDLYLSYRIALGRSLSSDLPPGHDLGTSAFRDPRLRQVLAGGVGGSWSKSARSQRTGKASRRGVRVPRSHGPKRHVSFLLTSHWLILSHGAPPACRGDWGVGSSSVRVTMTEEEDKMGKGRKRTKR